MSENLLFPVFFRLDKLSVLIVGAGEVGYEKVGMMFRHASNAHVTIVAPEIRAEIIELKHKYPTQIQLIQRPFEPDDLLHKDLVISATANRELNKFVWEMAKQQGVLANIADTPDLCDFYLGSVVQKGDLKIAISTNGKSPTLAKRIRELLEDVLPDEIDAVLDQMQAIRNQLKGDFEYKVKKLDEITKQAFDAQQK